MLAAQRLGTSGRLRGSLPCDTPARRGLQGEAGGDSPGLGLLEQREGWVQALTEFAANLHSRLKERQHNPPTFLASTWRVYETQGPGDFPTNLKSPTETNSADLHLHAPRRRPDRWHRQRSRRPRHERHRDLDDLDRQQRLQPAGPDLRPAGCHPDHRGGHAHRQHRQPRRQPRGLPRRADQRPRDCERSGHHDLGRRRPRHLARVLQRVGQSHHHGERLHLRERDGRQHPLPQREQRGRDGGPGRSLPR